MRKDWPVRIVAKLVHSVFSGTKHSVFVKENLAARTREEKAATGSDRSLKRIQVPHGACSCRREPEVTPRH